MNFSSTQVTASSEGGAWSEVLDRNVATTAACVTGCATVGLGALVFTTVTPGAAAVGIAATAGLAYVGDRQFKGLTLNPFSKESDRDLISMANDNLEALRVETQAEPEVAAA